MDGLIVVGLLALLTAFFLTKIRRRAGIATGSSAFAGIVVVFVIVVLLLWASGQN